MRYLVFILFSFSVSAQVFPGAVGYGSNWTFPELTAVYANVTSKADSGPGTLREAVQNATSVGVIVTFYGLSGEIVLNSPIDVNTNNFYLAGQTSPNGITIRSNGTQNNALFRTTGSPDGVIVRNLAFRRGPGATAEVNGDNITLLGGNNIIFDHCSFSWGTDENINLYGADNITFQNIINSETLMFSTHAYTTDPNNSAYYRPHSMGLLMGRDTNHVTFFNTLFAHNNQRNPLLGGDDVQGARSVEAVNMIIYNWGDFGFVVKDDTPIDLNLINHLHISGSDSRNNRYSLLVDSTVDVYARGVINNFRTSSIQPESDAIGHDGAPFEDPFEGTPLTTATTMNLDSYVTLTSQQLTDSIVKNAGTTYRDAIDQRVIDDFLNGTGSLIDDPSDVGGWITEPANGAGITDSDNDGIPDSEEGNFTTLFDYVNSLITDGSNPTFVPLTTFGITETSISIDVAETFQLDRFQTPSNATNQSDTWTTSDPSVATVSGSGLVTGVGNGTTKITRISLDSTNDPVFDDTCTVTVGGLAIPVTGITLAESDQYLFDRSIQLNETISPVNATNQGVVWYSSDEDVATVSESGFVKFNGKRGEVQIFVESVDGNFTDVIEIKFFPKRRQKILIVN